MVRKLGEDETRSYGNSSQVGSVSLDTSHDCFLFE
jgi:hypothetical protein